jgi:hypothetical protein
MLISGVVAKKRIGKLIKIEIQEQFIKSIEFFHKQILLSSYKYRTI